MAIWSDFVGANINLLSEVTSTGMLAIAEKSSLLLTIPPCLLDVKLEDELPSGKIISTRAIATFTTGHV